MNAAEVFTRLCEAIWSGDDWHRPAARYLEVRSDTVDDWSTGRRTFNPSVLDELEKIARLRGLAISGALGILHQYRETQ